MERTENDRTVFRPSHKTLKIDETDFHIPTATTTTEQSFHSKPEKPVQTNGAAAAIGRWTQLKALIVVAAQQDSKGIGRIRLRCIPDLTKATLHGFIVEAIAPGSTVRTDGLPAYMGLIGYVHDRQIQRRQKEGTHLLPRVHRVISLLKRWLLGTHQGAIAYEHLNDYLDEFTFRFNRRTSVSRGKLFYRLAQQAVQVDPAPFATLIKPQPLVLRGVK
jgi:transposase-like protein